MAWSTSSESIALHYVHRAQCTFHRIRFAICVASIFDFPYFIILIGICAYCVHAQCTHGTLGHTIEIGKQKQTLPSNRISDFDRLGVQRLHHPKSSECLHFNHSNLMLNSNHCRPTRTRGCWRNYFRDHWQVHRHQSKDQRLRRHEFIADIQIIALKVFA